MSEFDKFKESDIKQLIKDVFKGKISFDRLPMSVFEATETTLLRSVREAFGAKADELPGGSPAFKTIKEYEKNVNVFSAAKTFNQIRAMEGAMFDTNGNRVPFDDFEAAGKQIFDEFNKNWLKSEQITAERTATSGRNWAKIEENKDLFPLLQYQTQGDSRVRDEHERLDGITRPVDDGFWDSHMPPNGWRCRCQKPRQLRSGKMSDVSHISENDIDPLYRKNPGKDKTIFNDENSKGMTHPYMKVDKRFEVLKDENFGLPKR